MNKSICLCAMLLFAAITDLAAAGVTCNVFNVRAQYANQEVVFSLETDLPPNTEIIVDVSRSYLQRGSTDEYPISYFDGKMSVSELGAPNKVQVNDAEWERKLKDRQVLLSKIGEPIVVERVYEVIELNLVVPVNQKNPAFGDLNCNLVGTKVERDGRLRIIRYEKTFPAPFNKLAAKSVMENNDIPSLDPSKLALNTPYKLSKKTPLLKEIEPEDPLRAIAEMRYLPAGTIFQVAKKTMHNRTPYYFIIAETEGQKVNGWVNSIALIGQELLYER